MPLPSIKLTAKSSLPDDASATLVGRVWRPSGRAVGRGGARRRAGRHQRGFPDHARSLRGGRSGGAARAKGPSRSALSPRSSPTRRATAATAKPWLLAPIDLQAIKAAGVTFAVSMLERVIEEQARGAPDAAAAIRTEIGA